MTKARARERAKAKAGQKAKKHTEGAAQSGPANERFDSGAGSIKKPGNAAGGRSFAEMRRGASRSR